MYHKVNVVGVVVGTCV